MNCAGVLPVHHHQRPVDANSDNTKKRSVDQLYSPQQHPYGSEIDRIISQHMKIMRLEIQERQAQEAKLLASAIGRRATKVLNDKDDRIRSLCKLNSALDEKLKSLLVENQVWRELAHANQAAAKSLRANLQAQEDAESCCGSTGGDDEGTTSKEIHQRRCRTCGEREPCVLVLPCRHLCLCGVCGSGSQLQACPVCNATMKATLHVNMSIG